MPMIEVDYNIFFIQQNSLKKHFSWNRPAWKDLFFLFRPSCKVVWVKNSEPSTARICWMFVDERQISVKITLKWKKKSEYFSNNFFSSELRRKE